MLAPLNAIEILLSSLLHAPLRERMLTLAVACANVYGRCIYGFLRCCHSTIPVFLFLAFYGFIDSTAEGMTGKREREGE